MSTGKKEASVPPRRGQIKARIFESFAKSVVSTFSKAGQSLAKITGGGDSASSTPPTSSYSSEGNPDTS